MVSITKMACVIIDVILGILILIWTVQEIPSWLRDVRRKPVLLLVYTGWCLVFAGAAYAYDVYRSTILVVVGATLVLGSFLLVIWVHERLVPSASSRPLFQDHLPDRIERGEDDT